MSWIKSLPRAAAPQEQHAHCTGPLSASVKAPWLLIRNLESQVEIHKIRRRSSCHVDGICSFVRLCSFVKLTVALTP